MSVLTAFQPMLKVNWMQAEHCDGSSLVRFKDTVGVGGSISLQHGKYVNVFPNIYNY